MPGKEPRQWNTSHDLKSIFSRDVFHLLPRQRPFGALAGVLNFARVDTVFNRIGIEEGEEDVFVGDAKQLADVLEAFFFAGDMVAKADGVDEIEGAVFEGKLEGRAPGETGR